MCYATCIYLYINVPTGINVFSLSLSHASSGSLVSGVIGARKPVYDIWGNFYDIFLHIIEINSQLLLISREYGERRFEGQCYISE